jgi:hypothetical protein
MGEESRWGAAAAAAPSASHFSRFVLDQHSFIFLKPPHYMNDIDVTQRALTDFKR